MNQQSDNTAIVTHEDHVSLADILSTLSPVQQLACTMLAEFKPPAEVLSACRKEYGNDSLTESWINRASSPIRRPKVYRTVIEAIRTDLGEMRDEPMMSPAWRMEQRRKAMSIAERKRDSEGMLSVLDGVEKLTGHCEAPASPSQVNVQVNLGEGVSEARQRIEMMKAGSGGHAPIWPAGTPANVIDAIPTPVLPPESTEQPPESTNDD